MPHTLKELYAHLAISGNYLNETGEFPRTNIRWSDDGSYLVGRHSWDDYDKVVSAISESREYKLCNAEDDAKEKAEAFLVALGAFCADQGVRIMGIAPGRATLDVSGIGVTVALSPGELRPFKPASAEADTVQGYLDAALKPEGSPLDGAMVVDPGIGSLILRWADGQRATDAQPEPAMLAPIQGADMEACKAEAAAMHPQTDTDQPF